LAEGASSPYFFVYRRTSDFEFREVFHSHPEMEFTYVHEGYGTLFVDGQSYGIEPNSLLVFRPFQLHRVQIDVSPGRPFIRTNLQFDPALLKPYLALFPALRTLIHQLMEDKKSSIPIYKTETLHRLTAVAQLFHQASRHVAPREAFEEYILFLLNFLREFSKIWSRPHAESRIQSGHHDRAAQIMQWVEARYREPIRLELMAKELHMSHYYLSHLFKETTGTTIMAYIQATRIRHACMLLMQTSLSIPEIGARVGLPNPSHFCKVFKASMSVSPHQFRLRARQE
jgi:AraC-like DNA-binding protein